MVSNLFKFVLVSIFAATSFGCAFNPPITNDFDVDYNFSQLKSYSWITKRTDLKNDNDVDKEKVDTEAFADIVSLRQKRQISAIESILFKKGFIKSDSIENADFLIRSHNVTENQKKVETFYSVWGYYPYYHSPYIWPHRISRSIEKEYKIGTQIIDIIDAKSREVIWRGSVSQRLNFYKNRTPEQRNERILTNVELMLKSFPPESAK